MASSLTLPNHTLAYQLPSLTPKTQFSSVSQCLPVVLSKSSESQFYGLNFSYSYSLSIPSSSFSFKTSISAKVHCFLLPYLLLLLYVMIYDDFGVLFAGRKRFSASIIHVERSGWEKCEPFQV